MAGPCSRFPLAISRLVVARSTLSKRSATATLTHVPPVQVPKPPVGGAERFSKDLWSR